MVDCNVSGQNQSQAPEVCFTQISQIGRSDFGEYASGFRQRIPILVYFFFLILEKLVSLALKAHFLFTLVISRDQIRMGFVHKIRHI